MNDDAPSSTGGERTDAPVGDPSTQAVASLRGYAYQLYASALAWLRLTPEQELYLEVARDYALVAEDALKSVEVKDTAASSITIRSQNVHEALAGYVDLVARNPGRQVQLHYLTTSQIGVERETADRVQGEATLYYWRRAANSADVAPLREVLSRLSFADEVRAYIDARTDPQLRDELLRCVHWDCGQPGLDGIVSELRAALSRFASEHFGDPRPASDRLAGVVLQRLLLTIVSQGLRKVTRSDLRALLEDATSVSLPRRDFDSLIRAASQHLERGQERAALDTAHLPQVLEPEADAPLPLIVAERPALVASLADLVGRFGAAFVTGSTGSGKTLLARLAARALGGRWELLDLRDADTAATNQRLELALAALSPQTRGIILDDFNEIETPIALHALVRFIVALKRRDMACLITAYRDPSARGLSQLGLDRASCLVVPSLTVEEIGAMVTSAGGDGPTWQTGVYLASALGHPQLVQAVVMTACAAGWPMEECRRLQALTPSADVEEERSAVRGRLVAELPDETSALLYRMSLFIGRFDRQTAFAVAAVTPAIAKPGLHLDKLVGPWVEALGQKQFRISPLIQGAGAEVLSQAEFIAVHRTTAETLVGGAKVDVGKADVAYVHALFGKSERTLTKLALGVLSANSDGRRVISEWVTALRIHRLDELIYADKPYLAVLLRFAQFLLISSNADNSRLQLSWGVLQKELGQLSDPPSKQRLEYMILAKTLLDQGSAGLLPNWIGLITRFEELSRSDPDYQKFIAAGTASLGSGRSISVLGSMLSLQMHGLRGVAELSEVFNQIDALTKECRAMLFADMLAEPSDFGLIVNHSWLMQSKRENSDWVSFAASYEVMARQAQTWGYRELAVRCYVARSIVLDEYLNNSAAAERALDEARVVLGEDPVIQRALAKMRFRRKDYHGTLELLRAIAHDANVNSWIDRAFMCREAAISAGELAHWTEARQWFCDARVAAELSPAPAMKSMAVGLLADAAICAFRDADVASALKDMGAVLDALRNIDATSSINAGYCHRVVRHAIFWLFGKATHQEQELEGQEMVVPPGMCSNPEPADLKELPLASIGYARYLLAQTEVETGVNVGIADGLRAALGNRLIPEIEIGLRCVQIWRTMRESDIKGFSTFLPLWIDAQIFLKTHGADLHAPDPLNPKYGEIAQATPAQLTTAFAIFHTEDALLTFGIAAALQSRPAQVRALRAAFDLKGSAYPGMELLHTLDSGRASVEGPRLLIARHAHLVANIEDPTPEQLFGAGVAFTHATDASDFKRFLVPILEKWTRKRWQYVIENQKFYLRNPRSTVAAIEQILQGPDTGLHFLGRLHIAAEPAVKFTLDSGIRSFLLSL